MLLSASCLVDSQLSSASMWACFPPSLGAGARRALPLRLSALTSFSLPLPSPFFSPRSTLQLRRPSRLLSPMLDSPQA